MKFQATSLDGAYLILPEPRQDERGWFMRTYCAREFAQIGHSEAWVQMNHSLTRQAGAIRGLHFQQSPNAEIKLVRCIVGHVFDVIVDLRTGSPTLGKWVGVELSAENQHMLYIPKGFAHGFQTLSPDSQLVYCHSTYYTPDSEGAIRYNDPHINITWPLPVTDLSERDARHPLLDNHFTGLTS